MPLLHSFRPDAPHLISLRPRAAIPGGTFELTGTHLLTTNDGPQLPEAFFGDTPAALDHARPTRALDRVDADGNLFAMVSGQRGEAVPVSIFRIARDLQVSPFVRDVMNVSALAFGPPDATGQANLFASSRSEGTIYRITPAGAVSTFTEGMGIATGIAFDPDGNLYVGDRSGTIFKLSPTGEIFVFATLEPSVAFYHLCFRDDGTLLVTAPTTSSHQAIYAISPNGDTTVFYRGLGRPQGMALDVDNNLYVAASLQGNRGIIRITPQGNAELVVAGNDLVGLCFLDDGCAALATNSTIFHTDLGIEGRPLI